MDAGSEVPSELPSSPQGEVPPEEAPREGGDDLRERFRAALDAKHARHHGSVTADPGDDAKAHGGSAPVGSKRQFRRKSG